MKDLLINDNVAFGSTLNKSEFDSLMENCKEIPTAIGLEFNRDGRRWRVASLCDTFVIATAIDAVLDNHGEPSRSSDIIKVML